MTQLTHNRHKILRDIHEMPAEKLHFFYIKMLGFNLIPEIYRPFGLYEISLKIIAMSEAVSKMAEVAIEFFFERLYKDWILPNYMTTISDGCLRTTINKLYILGSY